MRMFCCLTVTFSVFIFSMPSKGIIIVIKFMFSLSNGFCYNESESDPKHIYAGKHVVYCYIFIILFRVETLSKYIFSNVLLLKHN